MNDQNNPLTGRMDESLQREVDAALGDMNLDDLMAAEDKTSSPTDEKTISGTVVAVEGDDIFVDIGGRSEALLPAEQFRDEPLPEVGSSVDVIIAGFNADDGILRLRRPGAIQEADWDTLEVGQVVEGSVTGINKGGLELKVNGIRAFMPISQIEMHRVEELDEYLGRKLEAVIAEAKPSEKNLVLSRRELLKRQAAEMREQTWANIHEGQIVEGVVRNIMPYGAFVDIGGVDGLLHVKDMSHSHVDKPEDIVHSGQQIEVRVIGVDRENDKVALGLKQTMPSPWENAEHKWPVDSIVSGRITRLADFGAFCELDEGVEGLVPISELTFGRRVGHPREVLNKGDVVKVRVLSVEPDRERISLSLKRVGDDPWVGASVRWAVDSVATGTVSRIVDFGAFVELAEGVEGLVHISEIAPRHVSNVHSELKEGQSVEAKVLEVDEERRRISLSIKQARAPQAEASAEQIDAVNQDAPDPRKRNKKLKGGLDVPGGGMGLGDLKIE